MHQRMLEEWQHDHNFLAHHAHGEKRTRYVLYLTLITMLIEITVGTLSGSMALLADGWHMATHVAAFSITLFAYRYAKQHQADKQFAFGTGKVSVLGGFASAIALGSVALFILIESLERFFNPEQIHFDTAIMVAVLGLSVNLISAYLLKDHHHHHNDHHSDDHHAHDHNLKAAYFHVLADALTSVLAIAALLAGKYFGLVWLDPIIGIIGSVIISVWSWQLIKETSIILLDGSIEKNISDSIYAKIESDRDNRIADFHIWHISPQHYAAVITIVTAAPLAVRHYHELLSEFPALSHVNIEIHRCDDADCQHEVFN